MARVVLDSSLLIALSKPSDAHHQTAVKALKDGKNELIISALSLTEVLVYLYKISKARPDEYLRDLQKSNIAIEPVSLEISVLAAEHRAKLALKVPDAIISATARTLDAVLWTFDKQLAKATPKALLLK